MNIVYPDGLDSVTDGWHEVLFTMDSGARDTVVGVTICPNVQNTDSRGSLLGLKYEVANGQTINNKGQKYLYGYTDEGMAVGVTAQVAAVNKPLMSVMRTCSAGNRVIFDDDGSYVENKSTGEKSLIRNDGNRYIFPLWVQAGFTGQGS